MVQVVFGICVSGTNRCDKEMDLCLQFSTLLMGYICSTKIKLQNCLNGTCEFLDALVSSNSVLYRVCITRLYTGEERKRERERERKREREREREKERER